MPRLNKVQIKLTSKKTTQLGWYKGAMPPHLWLLPSKLLMLFFLFDAASLHQSSIVLRSSHHQRSVLSASVWEDGNTVRNMYLPLYGCAVSLVITFKGEQVCLSPPARHLFSSYWKSCLSSLLTLVSGGCAALAEWRPTIRDENGADSDSAWASQSGDPADPWWYALPHTHREEETNNGGEEDQSKDPEATTVHTAIRMMAAVCHALNLRLWCTSEQNQS